MDESHFRKMKKEFKAMDSDSFAVTSVAIAKWNLEKNALEYFKEGFPNSYNKGHGDFSDQVRIWLSTFFNARPRKTLLELEFSNEACKSNGPQNQIYQVYQALRNGDSNYRDLLKKLLTNILQIEHTDSLFAVSIFTRWHIQQKGSRCTRKNSTSDFTDDENYLFIGLVPYDVGEDYLWNYNEKEITPNVVEHNHALSAKIYNGFFFPTPINDSVDVNRVQYYSPEGNDNTLAIDFLQCQIPTSKDFEKKAFKEVMETTFENEVPSNLVANIMDDISNKITASQVPPKITKEEFKEEIAKHSDSDTAEKFDETYQNVIGNTPISSDSIANKTIQIVMDGVKIQAKPNRISKTKINGEPVFLIPIQSDVVKINDINSTVTTE